MKTVTYDQLSMKEAIGLEEDIADILLLDNDDLNVKFSFASKTCNNYLSAWSSTRIIVEKIPEIHIKYKHPVSIETVRSDIQMNMEFWGIIIGRVSTVEEILIHFSDSNTVECHDCKQMYINADYSYNLRAMDLFHRTNTDYKLLKDSISTFYEGWSIFYHNEKYDYIRNNYFMVNRKTKSFLEDIFVTYVRFLEGYELRISGDDNKKETIKKQIKSIEKEIKLAIRVDDIKKKIEEAIAPTDPDWKLNSDHSGEMAAWIANGFIGNISLDSRLKKLDDKYLNIISKNKAIIEKDTVNETLSANDYYKMIANTRHYFSHFKEDETGILSTSQMTDTVNVLKGLILMIFYDNMGMSTDYARSILIRNSELGFETQCLLTEEEKKHSRASNAVDAQVII